MRLAYRVGQFWRALTRRPTPDDLRQAQAVLGPELMRLFERLQPGEQAHSCLVWKRLRQAGEDQPDLLAAALLHDLGKARLPLRLWHRVLIVLTQAWAPEKIAGWGGGVQWYHPSAAGWRRPFAAAVHHPEWGADWAQQAGASALTVELIRYHQTSVSRPELEPWLSKLQASDDES